MERLQKDGIGAQKKQAEILKEEKENRLWEKSLLGDAIPQTLLDTVIFYNSLLFALRSGIEHHQLHRHPCKLDMVERQGHHCILPSFKRTSLHIAKGM